MDTAIGETVQLSTGPERVRGENYGDWKIERDKAIKNDLLGLISTNDSVGKAFLTWLEFVWAKGKRQDPSYIQKEQIYLHNMKGDPLMSMKLTEIKSLHIQKFADRKAEHERSYNQIDLSIQLLNSFFKYVKEEGYIQHNPCNQISILGEKPEAEDEGHKIVVYPAHELEAMFKYVKGMDYPQIRFYVFLAAGTGARIGELLALDISDIDDSYILHIFKTVYRKRISRGKYTIAVKKIPKTKSSKRNIALSDTVIKEFQIYRKYLQELYLRKGLGKLKPDTPLFLSKQGKRLGQTTVYYQLKKISQECGYEYKSPHAFRHTFITKLAQQGTQPTDVMQITGHKNIEQLLPYYHIEMEFKKKIIDNIEGIF